MFAVIESGGKQYKVCVGTALKLEKLDAEVGTSINLKTLLVSGDKKMEERGNVVATVLEHRRDDKIIVFKKRRRQNYRRKQGHRQSVTVLRVTDVSFV